MESGRNKRQHIRTKLQIPIKVLHPRHGELILQTADVSEGGAFFLCDNADSFQLHEEFQAQVILHGEEPPPEVTMRVVRLDKSGVGLVYI